MRPSLSVSLSSAFRFLITVLLVSGSAALAQDAAEKVVPPAPGLGPAGALQTISFEETSEPVLRGPDARRQLLVTGKYASGQLRDLTTQVTYQVEPASVLTVDSQGFVTPTKPGEAVVTAQDATGKSAQLKLAVEQFDSEQLINFPTQVVPILTKLGCNTGACHGKSSGQNGFKLSLLGFYPSEDYEYLVKEQRGRRIFPSSPEFSLLLLKPLNRLPHGGGKRLEEDSLEYHVLTRWIEQGMPYGTDEDPVVTGISVYPQRRVMPFGGNQQVAVIAQYSDGTTQDVTRMVKYDSNDQEIAEVTRGGQVRTAEIPGEVAIMVRFQDQVAAFRATVPMGLSVQTPGPRNFIDQHVFAKLKTLGIPPSGLCDDATFVRRASLDITGMLPTAERVEKFLANKDPKKRDKLIDELLASPAYGDYFANKWNHMLRNQRTGTSGQTVTLGFHKFVRDSMANNVPYDQFVRRLLTATGDARSNPAANWFNQVASPVSRAEDVAQLFLGLRIQCAHCHHHPFEKWSQDDYFGMTAFFTRVKVTGGKQKNDKSAVVAHDPGEAKSQNPRSGEDILPTGLGGEPYELKPEDDPRAKLVDWMTSPENPFFATTLANRYWKHFFSRGIVDPEDDMRVTNPPSNPELLAALAQHFRDNKYDLKGLVRTICQSTTYQLSSIPNDYNYDDKQNFSRYYPKRLEAEVLFDSINQVSGATTEFKDLPKGTRAVQLPDNSFDNYFLTVFGKPQAATACECERSEDANLAQSLHLLNSPEVQGKISAAEGTAVQLSQAEARPHLERVRQLYLTVLGRPPREHELSLIMPHLETSTDQKQAYEDVLWALINTKEFLFNH